MKFDASTKPEANLKKLMNGRNDLWLASNATVAGNTKKLKIDINELEQVLVIQNTFMSIAINKNTPDTLVNLWQQAFDELVKEGTVKKILQKHGLENLYPSFQ